MKKERFWKNPGYKVRPPLKEDVACDYLIVGGGVTGVSAAYFLAKLGAKNVCLIEKNEIGSGATGNSAGLLTLKAELDLQEIIKAFGPKEGKIFWKAAHKGLDLLRHIIRKEKIKCNYDPESTIYGCSEVYDSPHVLNEYIVEKDIESTTRLLTGKELQKQIKTPLFKYAVYSKEHCISVNPLKFVQNFSKVVEKKGVKIYENTPLVSLRKNTAVTSKGRIKFKNIILAMDASLRCKNIKKLETTLLVTKPLTNLQLKKMGLKIRKVVWDEKDVQSYFNVMKDRRLLLGYGDLPVSKKHRAKVAHAPHVARMKKFLRKIFPNVRVTVEYIWSGTFGETSGKMPLIEKKGNKILVGGAASQLFSMMAARHAAFKIMGKEKQAILEKVFH